MLISPCDFQVVQESPDDIVVRIAAKPGYTEKHTSSILRNILLAAKARVRIELIDRITPGNTSKVSHIVSKIATDHT